MTPRDAFLHTPFYCEENAWHLCQSDALGDGVERRVLFISNQARQCALWFQRAAPPREPIVWDYHVVVLTCDGERWALWDLDTRLDFPMDALEWLRLTFWGTEHVPTRYAPRFRLLTAQTYTTTFSSDRSHMRRRNGLWLRPPPPWPPIQLDQTPMNLQTFTDMATAGPGELHDLASLRARLAPPCQERSR